MESPVLSKTQQYLLAAFLLIGIAARFYDLGARPYHHDESLHGMYGRYFYDFPDNNFYRYDPMLHGPFLYNMLRIVYSTFGDSDAGTRLPMAIIGSFLLFVPFLCRKYLDPRAILTATATLALSPTLIYWSKFIREDMPVIGIWAILLLAAFTAPARFKPLIMIPAILTHFTMKENSYVFTALLIGFCTYEFALNWFFKLSLVSTLQRTFTSLRTYWAESLLGLAIGAGIFCYLFSAGLRHSEGILDGLYRKGIGYWLHHHNIERIQGPFLTHLYIFSWYEFAFLVAVIAQVVLFYRFASRYAQIAGGLVGIAALIAWYTSLSIDVTKTVPWTFFKLKDSLDVLFLLPVMIHPIILTTEHLLKKEQVLGFFGYFGFATLFTYSYLGEKVPWLSMYPLYALIIYLVLYFQHLRQTKTWELPTAFAWSNCFYWVGSILTALGFIFMVESNPPDERYYHWSFVAFGLFFIALGILDQMIHLFGTTNLQKTLALVAVLFTARAAILTNFVYEGRAREYLCQVHTTPEFHDFMHTLRHEDATTINGRQPQILIDGTATWPATWYLRDIKGYKFSASPSERPNFDYIVQDFEETPKNVPPGFTAVKMDLRGWWVPEFQNMTLKRFLNYTLNHTPWNGTGFSSVHLLVKDK